MSDGSEKLHFQVLLEEFLADREWQDELEVDTEERSVMLRTTVNIAEHEGGDLIIEASDVTELVAVYFYFPFTCKDSKRREMKVLLNDINMRRDYGCFQCIPDGRVRWVQKVDFEGSVASAKSINQIVGPGWATVARWADVIAAVAITKQTAEDALEEFDEEQRKQQEAEENGPTEL